MPEFDCIKCRAVYYHCMTQNYHLCNDYYYFVTDAECELQAREALGKIKAYQDVMNILRSGDQSAGKVCDGRGGCPE